VNPCRYFSFFTVVHWLIASGSSALNDSAVRDEQNYVVAEWCGRDRVPVVNPPGLCRDQICIIDGEDIPDQDYHSSFVLAPDARSKGQRGVTGSAHNTGQGFPENLKSLAVFLKYLLNFN
jgi:hypothetical protein